MQFSGRFGRFLIVWRSNRSHTGNSFRRRLHVTEVLNGSSIQVGSRVALPFYRVSVPHPIPLSLPATVAVGSVQGLSFVPISVNGVTLARIVMQMLLLLLTTIPSASTAPMSELAVIVAPAHGAQVGI